MKSITIPYKEHLETLPYHRLSEAMSSYTLRQQIDQINWKEYPHSPITVFDLIRSDDYLFIRFTVYGEVVNARFSKSNDPVFKDSCVEFFVKEPSNPKYFNFEFNCIGTCLASTLSCMTDREYLSAEQISEIITFPSLGREGLIGETEETDWELIVGIPFKLFRKGGQTQLRANFYKCGDETACPHFASWNPVMTESPSFHQPDYFGELNL